MALYLLHFSFVDNERDCLEQTHGVDSLPSEEIDQLVDVPLQKAPRCGMPSINCLPKIY